MSKSAQKLKSSAVSRSSELETEGAQMPKPKAFSDRYSQYRDQSNCHHNLLGKFKTMI